MEEEYYVAGSLLYFLGCWSYVAQFLEIRLQMAQFECTAPNDTTKRMIKMCF